MTTITTTLVSGQNAHVGSVSSRGEYSVSVNSGIQGPAGANGVGITAANVVSGNLVLTYSNSAIVDVGTVVGANGAAGPTGASGATGPAGANGVSVVSANVATGNLIITLSNSAIVDAGNVSVSNAAYLGGIAANQYAYANQITTYTLPVANTTTLGGVQVDGTTITISSNTISANLTDYVTSTNLTNNLANYATTTSLGSYQTSAGLSANVATLTANNASYLGGIAANQYAYANQIVTYTLPTASTTTLGGVKVDGTTITIAANGVISSSGGGSFTNGQSISVANLTITGSLTANGGTGTAGQVLTSNGTAAYWSTVAAGGGTVNVDATYAWTNTHVFSNTVTSNGGGFSPTSNTVGTTLGTTTQRWVILANTGTYSGAVTVNNTLAAGNTTITGFINVSSTANVGGAINARSTLTVNGAVTIANTLATGNTTITGFANVSSTLAVTGAATFSNTVAVAANITGTSANVTITAGSFTTTFANNGVVTFPANVALGTTTITANGGVGTAGQFLTSGATGNVYWSSLDLSSYTGTASFANATVTNTLTVSNTVFAVAINETFLTYSTAISGSPTITFDCANGNIWNVTSSISSNWTANFTNLGLTTGYTTGITMIVNQGATAYIPSALQIESVSTSINWQGGSAPTGSANKKDVFAFSVLQTGAGTYTVFGQMVSFG